MMPRRVSIAGSGYCCAAILMLLAGCARPTTSKESPAPMPRLHHHSVKAVSTRSPQVKPLSSLPIVTASKSEERSAAAVAYIYNRMLYAGWPLLRAEEGSSQFHLAPDRRPEGGVPLSPNSVHRLEEMLRHAVYRTPNPEPFRPQHAVLFLDAKQEVQQALEISFDERRAQLYSAFNRVRKECTLDLATAAAIFNEVGLSSSDYDEAGPSPN